MRRHPTRRHIAFAAAFALLPLVATALDAAASERILLDHPAGDGRQVELFVATPPGDGGHLPVVLYVHGHQFGERPGGRAFVDLGVLARTARGGRIAAAVSQPGYGTSEGPPDFCGPRSHQAVHAAIAYLRSHPRVDPERIALFGHSRGAIVSSVVAVEDDRLAAVILRGGIYDMADAYDRLDPSEFVGAGIRANIEKESGATPEAFHDRSALLRGEISRVPTLFLHGEDDDRSPIDQVRALAERLASVGTPVEVRLFRGEGHRVPARWRRAPVERFLARYLDDNGAGEGPQAHARRAAAGGEIE